MAMIRVWRYYDETYQPEYSSIDPPTRSKQVAEVPAELYLRLQKLEEEEAKVRKELEEFFRG